MKKKLTKKIREPRPFVIDESLERFFPPVSRMGFGSPSKWEKIKSTSSQRTAKPLL